MKYICVDLKLKKISRVFIPIYIVSVILTCFIVVKECENTSIFSEGLSGDTLGILSVSNVYPVAGDIYLESKNRDTTKVLAKKDDTKKIAKKNAKKKDKKTEIVTNVKNSNKPQVLIVHTHATESYLPASSGNYHTSKEENTVRDVGNIMAKYLNQNGIAVYHDKTLHDDPSYNESYSKCYDTVEALLAKYPSIKCVIDLHRDAIPSSVDAATVNVNGNICSAYSYVVGSLATTVDSNRNFITELNQSAAKLNPDFVGKVTERGYTYNQSLCNRYLLLEVGNNRNNIKEVRNTARYLAQILAKNLK